MLARLDETEVWDVTDVPRGLRDTFEAARLLLDACEPARTRRAFWLMSFVALAGRKGFRKVRVEGVRGDRGIAAEVCAVARFDGCARPTCFMGARRAVKGLEGEGSILGVYCCGPGVVGLWATLDGRGGAVIMLATPCDTVLPTVGNVRKLKGWTTVWRKG
jgi:hypothetical protein